MGLVDHDDGPVDGRPDPVHEPGEDRGHEHERVRSGDHVRVGEGVLQHLVGAELGILAHPREVLGLRMLLPDPLHPLVYVGVLDVSIVSAPALPVVPALVLRAELGYLLGGARGEVRVVAHHGAGRGGAPLYGHAQQPVADGRGLAYHLLLLRLGACQVDDLHAAVEGRGQDRGQRRHRLARAGARLDDGTHAVGDGGRNETDQLPLSGTGPVGEEVRWLHGFTRMSRRAARCRPAGLRRRTPPPGCR